MKARSGGGHRPGFEGGQMPLYRRLPHRGFNNINRVDYAVVNLAELQELEGKSFGIEELKAAGLVRSKEKLLKILAAGNLTRAITVKAHRFSTTARAKIEAAGGKVVLIESAKAVQAAE
jgi:large subunit ribosomal protein L15